MTLTAPNLDQLHSKVAMHEQAYRTAFRILSRSAGKCGGVWTAHIKMELMK
jgi:hypothetical protein